MNKNGNYDELRQRYEKWNQAQGKAKQRKNLFSTL